MICISAPVQRRADFFAAFSNDDYRLWAAQACKLELLFAPSVKVYRSLFGVSLGFGVSTPVEPSTVEVGGLKCVVDVRDCRADVRGSYSSFQVVVTFRLTDEASHLLSAAGVALAVDLLRPVGF